MAASTGHITRNIVTTGLSSPAIHVFDRAVNSYRETSSLRPSTYETHSVAFKEQLAHSGNTRKGDPYSQLPAPPLTMVARRRQRSLGPTITPNKTCSATLYRRIKRRVGRSLKRMHCQRSLVTAGKQATHKLPRVKGSLPSLKRISRPLHQQHSSGRQRQHYSSVVHKQGRGYEVGPSMCPTMEDLDLV